MIERSTVPRWVCAGLAGALALLVVPDVLARSLTLAERVDCQRSVDGVYWQHRTWPAVNPGSKPALSQVLSDDAVRAKVMETLKRSSALERWGRPITADQLRSELSRMVRETRRPDMLAEVFAALGDDPIRIGECVVRPILADRLIDDLAAQDEGFASWWAEADAHPANADADARGNIDPATELDAAGELDLAAAPLQLTPVCQNDTWTATNLTGAPSSRSGHAAIWTGSEMIVWGGVNDINGLPINNGKRYDPATNAWTNITTTPAGYSGGAGLSAVWTGSKMIVWGGGYEGGFGGATYNEGGRYDPTVNSFDATSMATGVPVSRENHSAVWTGTRMVIWGGFHYPGGAGNDLDTGGSYDPVANTWVPINAGLICSGGTNNGHSCQDSTQCPGTCNGGATPGASCVSGSAMDCAGACSGNPSVRCLNNSICQSTGAGTCNPGPGTCVNFGSCQALAYHPSARTGHRAVWAGNRMVVWGGGTNTGGGQTNTGGRYDPATDLWTPTSTAAGVPSARIDPATIWTGTEMIVWGGSATNTGGRYDPVADTWTPTSTGANNPPAATHPSAVWTGDEMIVWNTSGVTGGRYRPSSNTWSSASTANAPSSRSSNSTAWTGNEMIIWGGSFDSTGARYCAQPSCQVATWYHDSDGDGYGNSDTVLNCTQPSGYVASGGDCNESNASIHPGAVEQCDGIDNDCDGTVDPLVPAGNSTISLTWSGGQAHLAWPPLAGAATYDVVRGSLSALAASHGNFTVATDGCVGNDLALPSAGDPGVPAAGQGKWYVMRGANCAGVGTYDSGAASQVGSRDAEIQASSSACP